MIAFVVYDAAGTLLRWGECPEDMLTIQAAQGEAVLQVDDVSALSSSTHRVHGGALVLVATVTGPDLVGRERSARARRAALLAESDFTQLADTSPDAALWAVYRQALRDLPDQTGWPANIVWPSKPA